VRAVRLEMGGRTRRVAASCDYHLPAPCPGRRASTLRVPDGTPDGAYGARIVAEDASGNPTALQRTISVDGTPPGAVLERASGRTIVLSLTDNAYANVATGRLTEAPAAVRDGAARGAGDRGR
jgi:hypothetical protein